MMKANKIIVAAALCAFAVSCADQDIDNNFVTEKPDYIDSVEAVNAYGNIKDYVDRSKYPNFKIACAIGADQYNDRGVAYRVANLNFDEITLGNAMKYGSVVKDNGTLNTKTITDLLDNAETAGMSVYGHTLVWHAQQNLTYINSLLADAAIEIKPSDRIDDVRTDFSQYTTFPFEPISKFTPEITDGVLKASVKSKKFYVTPEFPAEEGKEYTIVMYMRANKESNLTLQFGASSNKVKIPVTDSWSECTIKATAQGDKSFVMVDAGPVTLDVEIAWVEVYHFPPNSRPLTWEEKVDNLTNEMERWIDGMMEVCDGRVKAWDLVNEAISGGGNVNGYYDLQHGSESNTADFFWQDYLGSEDFVPIAEAAARKSFAKYGGNPADLKLFANDYNLESDWDDNMKLKSLIYWVGVWEKKGAKIDGLSSQMHISYYENTETMKSKAAHMVKMLHMMAETGKLVRISELDMGYVDINGKDVATADMTPQQLQNMANYYRFIIQMYLKIVPPEQQYSICQWCLTDSPAKSGWRANTPVGLWTENWVRKLSYIGYCEALNTPIAQTEDFFEFLKSNGLTHYVAK